MTHIFYSFVLLCILIEYGTLTNMKKIKAFTDAYRSKGNSGEAFRNPAFALYGSSKILYFLVCLVGLFSSQWIGFFLIFLQSITMKRLRRKAIWLSYIYCVQSTCILLFILLNKYLFHINIGYLLFG